jgi:MSHA biogenesis protein MshJ
MNSLFSFRRIRDKFYTLSAREQLLVVLVLGVAIYFVFESLVFEPQRTRNMVLMNSQAVLASQAKTLRTEILTAGQSDDVLSKAQAEHAQLKQQMAMLDAIVGGMQGNTPQVGDLARRVLKDYPRVTLDSLKTLPVKALIVATPAKKDAAGAAVAAPVKDIYKHGVELEIHGNYLDLLAYLKNLESTSKNVFWSDMKLHTVKYPETSLRVTIFILSDQPVLKIS